MDGLRDRVDRVRRTALRLPTIGTFALEWSDPPFVGGHWIPGMIEVEAYRAPSAGLLFQVNGGVTELDTEYTSTCVGVQEAAHVSHRDWEAETAAGWS